MEDMLSFMKRYVEEHDLSLEDLEDDWQQEEQAPWTHDLETIKGFVHDACEESDTGRCRDEIHTWLPTVERYWKEHPAYPSLRDALLTRLAQLDEAEAPLAGAKPGIASPGSVERR
jgi:hypothetical protein